MTNKFPSALWLRSSSGERYLSHDYHRHSTITMPSNITPDTSTENGDNSIHTASCPSRSIQPPLRDAPTLAEAAAARACQVARSGIRNITDDGSKSEDEPIDEEPSESNSQENASPGSDLSLLNILRSIPGTRQSREVGTGHSTGKWMCLCEIFKQDPPNSS